MTMIKVTYSESDHMRNGRVFGGWLAFDEAVSAVIEAEKAEGYVPGHGYFKTKFEIDLDGETYEGRFDIGCDHPTLFDHVIDHCENAGGWLSGEQLAEHVANRVDWVDTVRTDWRDEVQGEIDRLETENAELRSRR